ncbi:Hypothetical predicted protein [Olea europaea subsp. europaea]|uniref:Uncharacterized protein n=1 Tax=Olea europaea subsp. europaea TaxID=158383 RepID=A0A8S0QK49_OLEEU|nr:Hypothetical predicted protein [Olea europaea subsp. europaea]
MPQLPQQSLLRPPMGLSMPPTTMQQMQYSGITTSLQTGASSLPGSNLNDHNSPLVPNSSSSANVPPIFSILVFLHCSPLHWHLKQQQICYQTKLLYLPSLR